MYKKCLHIEQICDKKVPLLIIIFWGPPNGAIMKWKTKNTTMLEHFQNIIERK